MSDAPIYPATGRPFEGCGFGTCSSSSSRGGPGCYLCDTIARLEQPRDRAGERKQANAARDGAPKLSGEKQRGNLAFEKRRRQGPHRSNV